MNFEKLDVVEGYRVRLRLVQPNDGAYIYGLRTNPAYNKYLSTVSGGIADQVRWIEDYKFRETAGMEFYYVIERLDKQRCGVVRLYDLTASSFTWGSIILDYNKPSKAALEATLLSMSIGFEVLSLPVARLKVCNANSTAIAFYRRFGMLETGADNNDTYFTVSRIDFAARKSVLWDAVKRRSKLVKQS